MFISLLHRFFDLYLSSASVSSLENLLIFCLFCWNWLTWYVISILIPVWYLLRIFIDFLLQVLILSTLGLFTDKDTVYLTTTFKLGLTVQKWFGPQPVKNSWCFYKVVFHLHLCDWRYGRKYRKGSVRVRRRLSFRFPDNCESLVNLNLYISQVDLVVEYRGP